MTLKHIVEMVAAAAATAAATWPLEALLRRRRRRKLMRTERIDAALRLVAGAQDGLTTGWRGGIATLSPGRLGFRSRLGGFWFLRRPAVSIPVVSIETSLPRTTRLADSVWIAPGLVVVAVTTPTALLELAVEPRVDLDWLVSRLR